MRCRVKICGVTTVADAMGAAESGADAVGLNFYAPSPRCVSEEVARDVVASLPPFVAPVMLAVDEPWSATAARLDRLGLMAVQIHGRELSPCPIRPWMPAFSVKDAASLRAIEAFLTRCRNEGNVPTAILIDAHVAGSFGGTGQVAPWELVAAFRPGVPIILAGGLTPENVADAVRIVRPYAVDVASGVERSPGVKDADRMRRFVESVRESG